MSRGGLVFPGLLVLGLVGVGLAFLPFDLPLAHLMLRDWTPQELRAIFRRAEVFGHGYGIAAAALTIYLLNPERRRFLPRLVMNCLAAGLSADVIKTMVWRIRPRTFEALAHKTSTWAGSVFTTSNISWDLLTDSSHHSFPSAHTATAVAMAYSLTQLYPAGRYWFAVLAVFCMLNRIDGGAHYASDVCFGAALSVIVLTCLNRSERVNGFLAGWESPRLTPTADRPPLSVRPAA